MDNYLLCNDIYILIFNQLDLYSKYNYAQYLKDVSSIDFESRIGIPTDEDIISLYEYGMDKISNVIIFLKTDKFTLIRVYISNFICTRSFGQLIDILGYHVNGVTLKICADNSNYVLFKHIHKKYKIHYFKVMYNNKDINFIKHVSCNTCLSYYNDYLGRKGWGPIGPTGPKGSKGMSSREPKNLCKCGACLYPKRSTSTDKKINKMKTTVQNLNVQNLNVQNPLIRAYIQQKDNYDSYFMLGVLSVTVGLFLYSFKK